MTLRIAALLFGLVFILLGVAWHMPMFIDNGLLFGVFEVDSMHNMIHLGSGVIALVATTSTRLSRWCLLAFGIIYLVVGVAGFALDGDMQIMHMNTADNVLHLVIAAVALLIAFRFRLS